MLNYDAILFDVDGTLIDSAPGIINTLKEGGNDTPIYNNYNSLFVFKIESYTGSIILDNDSDMINPGETKDVTIELDTTVAMEKNTTFSIRENGRDIGTGTVTELIK